MSAQVTECTLEQLDPILRQDIGRSLGKDEQIVTCLVSRESGTVKVFLITSTRLIGAYSFNVPFTKRLVSPTIAFLSLAEIVKVDISQTGVTVTATEGVQIGCLFDTKERVQAFAASLQSTKDRLKAGLSQPKSPADRLRELAKLHSEGLISEAEFQQKRQEIMKQL